MNNIECPVFYPTTAEFQNFEAYMVKIESQSKGYGMAKVIPPAEWKARRKGYKDINPKITHPVRQVVSGLAGIYQVVLISERQMEYTAYKKYAKKRELNSELSVEEIERKFWKNIRYDSAVYGADSDTISLFDRNTEWNLSELSNLLEDGLKPLKLNGINTPFLYLGSWKSMFCWHKEDLDLYSINFLHFGKPKIWYCIPDSENEKFERLCQFHFREEYAQCKEFLRHKMTQISPSVLKGAGIKYHRAVHNPGEFMVIFSKCYHMGFNAGFNCAEAVNFATENWIETGERVRRCLCDPDCVRIDMEEFKQRLKDNRNEGNPHKRAKHA
ncbi:hypothetical protein SteCoe_29255 [Stentor coeruleus]|uniref:JmjC domain-containing protein n=1 Tax=Stentor coeruleus TaxID=5963 RepID=A0A1R2B6G8_9CILI|nr:hypothetical protein SteCoe_29255 [Stentor coeruleus]